MLSSKIIFLGLFFQLQTAFAQQLIIGNPTFGGNACSNGSARATLSPDGQQVSILFDQFIATSGGNSGLRADRKNCDIAIPVQVPQGYSVAVLAIDYRGFASLPQGAALRFSANYFFAGQRSSNYGKEFLGPMTDNYVFRNEMQISANIWSACGASVLLRTQASMVVMTNPQGEETTSTVDSMDVNSGITYNLQYKQCDSQTPIVMPPYPEQPPHRGEGGRRGGRRLPLPPPPIHPGHPPRPVPPPFVRPQPPRFSPADQNLIGYIDGFQNLGSQGALLNGWACAKTIEASVGVHIYIDQPAGQGQFIKGGAANMNSEPAVSQMCQDRFTMHRFSIPFSAEEMKQYSGRSLWVHGISPVGGANLTIQRSGEVIFPVTN